MSKRVNNVRAASNVEHQRPSTSVRCFAAVAAPNHRREIHDLVINIEASLGKASTDEVAIMVDTFKPLELSEAALECEDREYFRSWVQEPAST